jgi:hypothetical protein
LTPSKILATVSPFSSYGFKELAIVIVTYF